VVEGVLHESLVTRTGQLAPSNPWLFSYPLPHHAHSLTRAPPFSMIANVDIRLAPEIFEGGSTIAVAIDFLLIWMLTCRFQLLVVFLHPTTPIKKCILLMVSGSCFTQHISVESLASLVNTLSSSAQLFFHPSILRHNRDASPPSISLILVLLILLALSQLLPVFH
jgi:hypothetical protein